MKHYPYRTTYDKLEQSLATVQDAGDVVLSTHFLGGRDWVLLCRTGDDKTLVDATVEDVAAAIGAKLGEAIKPLLDLVARQLQQAHPAGSRRLGDPR